MSQCIPNPYFYIYQVRIEWHGFCGWRLHELFRQIIGILTTHSDRRGCLLANTSAELLPGNRSIQSLVQEARESEEAVFYEHIQKAMLRGELRADLSPQEVSAFLFVLHMGLTVASKVDSSPETLLKTARIGLQILE